MVSTIATQALQSQYLWDSKIGFRKPHTASGKNIIPIGPQDLWI